jgi:hypothetical protein
MWSASEFDVFDAESSQFRASQSRLNGDQEQCMVSPARPRVTIGRGEQGLDFRAGQVVNLPSHELLVRHRQHSLYKGAPPWLLQGHVTENERMAASLTLRERADKPRTFSA